MENSGRGRKPGAAELACGQRRDYAKLPHEILQMIFRATQPSRYECDPSIIPGPRNPWLEGLRTKKALTLVCKSWLGPATELLYEDVVFRRIGQVSALARTFARPHQRGLQRLVRSIRVDACVVPARVLSAIDIFIGDIDYILKKCTRLAAFCFRPHRGFGSKEGPAAVNLGGLNFVGFLPQESARAGRCAFEKRAATSLRTLDFVMVPEEAWFEDFIPILAAAVHLTSLALGPLTQFDDVDLRRWPALEFLALEDLRLDFTVLPEELEDYVRTKWRVPALKSLTCINCTCVPDALLRARGAHLRYLHFHYDTTGPWLAPAIQFPADALLPRLAGLCPEVEHLAYPLTDDYTEPLPVRSPTLRYLDIMRLDYPTEHARLSLARDARAPRLVSLRIVMIGQVDCPRVCHPTLIPPGQPERHIVHRFPNQRLVQTRRFVIHDPAVGGVLLPGDDDVEDADDRPYDPLLDEDEATDTDTDEGGGMDADEGTDTGAGANEDISAEDEDAPTANCSTDSGDTEDEFDPEWVLADECRRAIMRKFRKSQRGDFLLSSSDGEEEAAGDGEAEDDFIECWSDWSDYSYP